MKDIQSDKIPSEILNICDVLRKEGNEAFLVGGCVRDLLMNRGSSDFDIATDASSADIIKSLKAHGYNGFDKGGSCGTVGVHDIKYTVEITPYRTESGYSDFRHPDKVTFVKNLNEDLMRRDFTINAMALGRNGEIIDLFGGRNDLEKKLIRCVGNPQDRFHEDALRILRALRFASRFGFEIEEETSKAVFEKKALLNNISAERKYFELSEILLSEKPFRILSKYSEVIEVFLGKISVDESMERLPKDFILRFFSLIKDRSKDDVKKALSAVKSKNSERKNVLSLFSLYHEPYIAGNRNHIAINTETKRLMSRYGGEIFLLLLKFLDIENAETIDYIHTGTWCISRLAVNGNDLLLTGIPAVKIGSALNFLLEEVIEGKIENDREKLLNHVKNL